MTIACPKCLAESADDSKYCRQCATPLPASDPGVSEVPTTAVEPPLRDRPLDIMPLAGHLLQEVGRQLGRTSLVLDGTAAARLGGYHLPGNVGELRNVLERAAILSAGRTIEADKLSLDTGPPPGAGEGLPFDGTLEDLEREAIRRALPRPVATGRTRQPAWGSACGRSTRSSRNPASSRISRAGHSEPPSWAVSQSAQSPAT
jgi:hypothetical protein